MNRPFLRAELAAQNSRTYLHAQRERFLEKHGQELGAFYFLVMLLQTRGKKMFKARESAKLRALYEDLHAVYVKHTQ